MAGGRSMAAGHAYMRLQFVRRQRRRLQRMPGSNENSERSWYHADPLWRIPEVRSGLTETRQATGVPLAFNVAAITSSALLRLR